MSTTRSSRSHVPALDQPPVVEAVAVLDDAELVARLVATGGRARGRARVEGEVQTRRLARARRQVVVGALGHRVVDGEYVGVDLVVLRQRVDGVCVGDVAVEQHVDEGVRVRVPVAHLDAELHVLAPLPDLVLGDARLDGGRARNVLLGLRRRFVRRVHGRVRSSHSSARPSRAREKALRSASVLRSGSALASASSWATALATASAPSRRRSPSPRGSRSTSRRRRGGFAEGTSCASRCGRAAGGAGRRERRPTSEPPPVRRRRLLTLCPRNGRRETSRLDLLFVLLNVAPTQRELMHCSLEVAAVPAVSAAVLDESPPSVGRRRRLPRSLSASSSGAGLFDNRRGRGRARRWRRERDERNHRPARPSSAAASERLRDRREAAFARAGAVLAHARSLDRGPASPAAELAQRRPARRRRRAGLGPSSSRTVSRRCGRRPG